eukprot:gene23571-30184_t
MERLCGALGAEHAGALRECVHTAFDVAARLCEEAGGDSSTCTGSHARLTKLAFAELLFTAFNDKREDELRLLFAGLRYLSAWRLLSPP